MMNSPENQFNPGAEFERGFIKPGSAQELGPSVYFRKTTEALNSIEPGKEFFMYPQLERGILMDLKTNLSLEILSGPPGESIYVEGFLSEISAQVQEVIDIGPEEFANHIENSRSQIAILRQRLTERKSDWENTNKSEKTPEAEAAYNQDRDGIQEEIDRNRIWLAGQRQKLTQIAEDENTLKTNPQEALERLKTKKEQMDKMVRAVEGIVGLGVHLHQFLAKAVSLEGVEDIFNNQGVRKLGTQELEAITSLPRLGEVIDIALKTLLRMDIRSSDGKPLDHLMNENGGQITRNLCAQRSSPSERQKFLGALDRKVKEELIKRHGGSVLFAGFFAEKGREFAIALHEIFMESAFYQKPRMETKEGQYHTYYQGSKDEKEDSSSSMFEISNDAADKVFNTESKAKSESRQGFGNFLSISIRHLPDYTALDFLHSQEITLADGKTKKDAFSALVSDDVTVHDLFAQMNLGAHALWLYGLWNGARAWDLLGSIPRENIQLLPERLDTIRNAIRSYSEFSPSYIKTLKKALSPVLGKERGEIEAVAVFLNSTLAFLRKAISISISSGGDTANTERDVVGLGKKTALSYTFEQLVHERGVITPRQWHLIEEISTIMESPPRDHEAYRSGITISTEAIDSYPWLKEILAEKPTKYNKTAKNSLINEEQHPEATNWMWSRIENNLRNRKA